MRASRPTFSCFPPLVSGAVKLNLHGREGRVTVAADVFDELADPDRLPRYAARDLLDRAADAVRDVLPDLSPHPIRVGTYPEMFTTDGHPIIGPSADDQRIITAHGFSGHGFKMAPVFGEALADPTTVSRGTGDRDIVNYNVDIPGYMTCNDRAARKERHMEQPVDEMVIAAPPAELSMPLGLAMYTQRAIRRLRADPIPEGCMRIILEAAGKAPNGGNNQRARLLYVTDPDRIRAYGALYHDSWWAKRRELEGWSSPEEIPEDKREKYAPAMRLAEAMRRVPCLVFVLSLPPHFAESVFPAAQNLMLAARALGIGSVPTRLHDDGHDEFRRIFDVPEHVRLHLAIPLGYPEGNFGPTRRRPPHAVCFHQHWDGAVPWAPVRLKDPAGQE